MRKLILTTVAAVSIAAIPAIAGAQQQTGDPIPPAPVGPSVLPSGQAVDQSTSASTDAPADSSASSTSTDITTGAGASVEADSDVGTQAIGAPPATYPLCRGNIQDECVNPREAGKNFGNRPLKYWPGKPASE